MLNKIYIYKKVKEMSIINNGEKKIKEEANINEIVNEMIEKKMKVIEERLTECIDNINRLWKIIESESTNKRDIYLNKGDGIIYGSRYKMLVKEDIDNIPYIQILDTKMNRKYGSKLKRVKHLNN
jgi:hypothetical protein